ncbi:DUF1206 domain-containing protein [Arthrobacter monumenti]
MKSFKRGAGKFRDDIGPVVDAAEEFSNTKTLDVIARFGYAITGLLHLLIGVVALQLAMGGTGQADTAGAIETLAQETPGRIAVWAGFIGCMGLALWQLSEATLRARRLEPGERAAKMSTSGSLAVAYAVLALSFANFAVGPGSDSSRNTRHFSATVLNAPFGVALLIGVGVVVAVIGIYFVIKGLTRKFRTELHFADSNRGVVIDGIGVVGHVAKGIALVLVGVLFCVAAIQQDRVQETGLDGSLKLLLEQPLGPYLLGIIAVGFICHGCFGIIRSRYGLM